MNTSDKTSPEKCTWANLLALLCMLIFLADYGVKMFFYVAGKFGLYPRYSWTLIFLTAHCAAAPMLCIAAVPPLLKKGGLFASKGARRGLFWVGVAVVLLLLVWQFCASFPALRPDGLGFANNLFVYMGTYISGYPAIYLLPMQWMMTALLPNPAGKREAALPQDAPQEGA